MSKKRCPDCLSSGVERVRPTLRGGRCATHTRLKKKERSETAHAKRLDTQYGITRAEYEALLEFQGGRCAWCQRATGASRRLSVDHDHADGALRMLLCRTCNSTLGHFRDDPQAIRRGADLLEHTPAQQLWGSPRYVPADGAPVRGRPVLD